MKETLQVANAKGLLDTVFENMEPSMHFDLQGWIFLCKKDIVIVQYEIDNNSAWVNGYIIRKLYHNYILHYQQRKFILRQKIQQYASVSPKKVFEAWINLSDKMIENNSKIPVPLKNPFDE